MIPLKYSVLLLFLIPNLLNILVQTGTDIPSVKEFKFWEKALEDLIIGGISLNPLKRCFLNTFGENYKNTVGSVIAKNAEGMKGKKDFEFLGKYDQEIPLFVN
uniref:Uncharacterized protein n=1 Tax=Meloidogyne incognita TaxID=6306 RepID=A0A914M318_MELIC